MLVGSTGGPAVADVVKSGQLSSGPHAWPFGQQPLPHEKYPTLHVSALEDGPELVVICVVVYPLGLNVTVTVVTDTSVTGYAMVTVLPELVCVV